MKKRTWAEISLTNLEFNYRAIRERLGNTKYLGVVKANSYGHGAVSVAKRLEALGADYLAVACLDEALELRRNGITLPILILGYTAPEYAELLADNKITQSVPNLAFARELSARLSAAGKTLTVHIKIDSGMGRMGFTCHDGSMEAEDIIAAIALPGLDVEGVFTHFAVSDVGGGEEYTRNQLASFLATIEAVEKTGFRFRLRHSTNSGALLSYPEAYLDMARPGICLYGYFPDKETAGMTLKPVMTVKTRIYQIKDFPDGFTISYGRTYTAENARRIAVVPIGYADGLPRCLSGRMEMLVNGKKVPQVGRICMDMCMLDVTDVDAAVGDEVTVFGDCEITADTLAEKAGTISYELLTSVSPRVPRVYVE